MFQSLLFWFSYRLLLLLDAAEEVDDVDEDVADKFVFTALMAAPPTGPIISPFSEFDVLSNSVIESIGISFSSSLGFSFFPFFFFHFFFLLCEVTRDEEERESEREKRSRDAVLVKERDVCMFLVLRICAAKFFFL